MPGRPQPIDDSHYLDSGAADEPGEGSLDGRGYHSALTGETDAELREAIEEALESGNGDTAIREAFAAGAISENQLREALAEIEEAQFDEVEQTLRQAIEAIPELRELQDSLVIERTPEGLRIQIVDQAQVAMFTSGSDSPNDRTIRILRQVALAIDDIPNDLAISGYTDAHPFINGDNYGNWELSADRANASRRILEAQGIDAARFAQVIGKADTDPFVAEDPFDPRNRRISIVLLRENPLAGTPPVP